MCLLYQFHPYQTIFASTRGIESSSSPSSSFSSSNTTGARHKRKPQIILLGTSRIYYAATRERFHAALQFIIGAPQVDLVPVVVIASDAGTRGEARDEHLASGVWGWGLHVRTVLGWARIAGRAVCRDSTHRTNAHEYGTVGARVHPLCLRPEGHRLAPTEEMLCIIVNGDIRSAILALQFLSLSYLPSATVKTQAGELAREWQRPCWRRWRGENRVWRYLISRGLVV